MSRSRRIAAGPVGSMQRYLAAFARARPQEWQQQAGGCFMNHQYQLHVF
jgi:hypothetical protein